jgi:hypothetical protein
MPVAVYEPRGRRAQRSLKEWLDFQHVARLASITVDDTSTIRPP